MCDGIQYPKDMIVRKLARGPNWDIVVEFIPTGVNVSEQEWSDARAVLLSEWSKVPERYKFRAVDADGRRFYYTQKPRTHGTASCWDHDPECTYYDVWEDDDYVTSDVDVRYWKQSLEMRPY